MKIKSLWNIQEVKNKMGSSEHQRGLVRFMDHTLTERVTNSLIWRGSLILCSFLWLHVFPWSFFKGILEETLQYMQKGMHNINIRTSVIWPSQSLPHNLHFTLRKYCWPLFNSNRKWSGCLALSVHSNPLCVVYMWGLILKKMLSWFNSCSIVHFLNRDGGLCLW